MCGQSPTSGQIAVEPPLRSPAVPSGALLVKGQGTRKQPPHHWLVYTQRRALFSWTQSSLNKPPQRFLWMLQLKLLCHRKSSHSLRLHFSHYSCRVRNMASNSKGLTGTLVEYFFPTWSFMTDEWRDPRALTVTQLCFIPNSGSVRAWKGCISVCVWGVFWFSLNWKEIHSTFLNIKE